MSTTLLAADCTVPAPAEVAWLVKAIGERAALLLVETRGGTRVTVPRSDEACRTSILAEIMGAEAVRALARTHGGLYLKVPLARTWRAQIYMARGGMSQAEVALKAGLTESHVQRLAGASYQPLRAGGAAPRRSADTFDQPLLPF